jgi:hypothetical protein
MTNRKIWRRKIPAVATAAASLLALFGAPTQAQVARLEVHAFPSIPTTPVLLARNQTPRNCALKEEPLGAIVNAKTGKPFTFSDPCVELGPDVGYDPAATEAAVLAVKSFLRTEFRLN